VRRHVDEERARLDRVRARNQRKVIFDREARLLCAVVSGTTPARELCKLHLAEVGCAVDSVRNADSLALPVAPDIDRFRVFIEGVRANRQMVHHVRGREVPRCTMKIRIECIDRRVVERGRQADGAARTRSEVVVGSIEQVRNALVIGQRVIDASPEGGILAVFELGN